MNELHDYPPNWDDIEIEETEEFHALLSKNVEALFAKKEINQDFMVRLQEHESDHGNYLEKLVYFVKNFDAKRFDRDKYYSISVSDELAKLRGELEDLAIAHVEEPTKQELVEIAREASFDY